MSPPRGRKRRARKGQGRNQRKQRRQQGQYAAPSASSEPSPVAKRPAASRVASLHPLAPIIVRSGRPFDAVAGPDEARFPPPSTIAGCIRTAWARQTDQPFGQELAQLPVAGPLLVRTDGCVLVPKPADALYYARDCLRAAPFALGDGAGCDLPQGLLPVRLAHPPSGKPRPGPAWWALDDLLDFRRGQEMDLEHLKSRGWSAPSGDRRTHVAIGPRGAAEPGRLFQTEGLDFTDAPEGDDRLRHARSVRLVVRCGEELGSAAVHLGGERRLAALQPESPELWPVMPPAWLDEAVPGVCMTLLTPAVFNAGYRPGWLDEQLTGSPPTAPRLRLVLLAAAVERWQPNSGWDLAANAPRPTRKLAPAGATYWFRVVDGGPPELAKLWLQSISDDEQARRDGFGLALPAPWRPPD